MFKPGDKVVVHGALKAVVVKVVGNTCLVRYSDGKGADYMPIECLTLEEAA
jgi:preprotein translocase subunit YajC